MLRRPARFDAFALGGHREAVWVRPRRSLAAALSLFALLLVCSPQDAWAGATSGGLVSTSPRTPFELKTNDLTRLLRQIGARQGSVAFTDLATGASVGYGHIDNSYAWSTIKPLLLVSLIDKAGGAKRLSSSERADARSSITESDNEATQRLFAALSWRVGGSEGAARQMERMLLRGGDPKTRIALPFYGLTRWSVERASVFMSSLARGCLVPRSSTKYVLNLMGSVIREHRWGLGKIKGARFKGGWGPDPDGRFLVRQMGLLPTAGGKRKVVVALAVRPANGSFERGAWQLGRLAAWAKRNGVGTEHSAKCSKPRRWVEQTKL